MVRKATQNDSKDIALLIVRSWKAAYKGLIEDDFLSNMSVEMAKENWERVISSQNEEDNIFVYEENNKILGIIRFGMPQDKENKKYNAEIHVLYVEPDLKRQGIGSKLFRYAKEIFINQGRNDLIIWCLKGNEQGLNFYKKMGGKVISNRKAIVNNLEVKEIGLEFKITEEIYLEKPSKKHEKQAIEYKKEHFDNGEKIIHACSRWDKLESYDDWLKLLEDCSKEETVPEDWTVTTQFLGIRKKDNKLLGMISIRHTLTTDFLRNYAGHIGYGVRPTERRKGYVTEILRQALIYCKEKLKLEKVMISCDKENEASRKTIINAGGVLEREYQTHDGENVQTYWVEL